MRISSFVSFLVDTGADRSMVGPADAMRMGVRYDLLENSSLITGIGGVKTVYLEHAILGFAGSSHLHLYELPVGLTEHDSDLEGVPSLLGRDILDRWKIVYCRPDNILSFEVRTADSSVPIRRLS